MSSQPNRVFIAVDLGASSGRLVAGEFGDNRISLKEVHRFENGGIRMAERLHWDLPRLWQNIVDGLTESHKMYGDTVASVGVDTWGVDFGLLGNNDILLGNPYHYRDSQTAGSLEQAFEVLSREQIFAETGLQFMELNTLFQMFALKRDNSPILAAAKTFLMIPDLIHWLMTGEKSNEQTNASTTQLYNPMQSNWSATLLEKFELPTSIFQKIVPPGTNLGKLRPSIVEETGLASAEVILPGTHDTASAVLAVPAQMKSEIIDWCYISSGTWSLMGVESPKPIVTDRVRELNFTNEGGVGGTTRLLKNIAGLWLIQECRRIWNAQGKNYDWDGLSSVAQQSTSLKTLIDPDDSCFVAPKSMPQAILDYCSRNSLSAPENDGAIVRCILESLALRYRMVLTWLEELVGNQIETIHIVGGGTQNKLLCQMAADACNRRVIAGPIEATALGNIMMQAVSLGDVGSIAQAREIIGRSFSVIEYLPKSSSNWDDAYEKFKKLVL